MKNDIPNSAAGRCSSNRACHSDVGAIPVTSQEPIFLPVVRDRQRQRRHDPHHDPRPHRDGGPHGESSPGMTIVLSSMMHNNQWGFVPKC